MQSKESFTNTPIPISNLPKFETLELNQVNQKYKTVIIFNYLIIIVLIVVLLIINGLFINFETTKINIAAVVVFVLSSVGLFFNLHHLKTRKFCFRNQDVIYKKGLISETTTVIPYNKMQHLAVHQGWLSRRLQLASLEFFTAGGATSDLKIEGLNYDEALKWHAFVLNHISNLEAKTALEEINETTIPLNNA